MRLSHSPRLVLVLVAAVAVVSTCLPLFFGQSLVSPSTSATGLPLLYPIRPTLPGGVGAPFEDTHGSDVAALIYQHVPYSLVQGRALANGEWPVWNRYVALGSPLLAQGQSMIGDPLQWLVIAAGGRSWAWDLKFILVRFSFCFGIGLCGWFLTRDLKASAGAGFLAAFLGYFAYRYNHPAQFSLCYSPWILAAWYWVSETPDDTALWWRGVVLWAANWWVFSSGTVKEAVVLMAALNAVGLVGFLSSEKRWKRLIPVVAWLSVFGLTAAPLWLPFLRELSYAFTSYAVPRADQVTWWKSLVLGDDLFYRQIAENERVLVPSLNLVALMGCLVALTGWRESRKDARFWALAVVLVLAWASAYSLVPERAFLALPFVRSIYHIFNVASCVFIVVALVLCARGFQRLRAGGGIVGATVVFTLFLVTYLGGVWWSGIHPSMAMACGVLIAATYVVLAMEWLKRARPNWARTVLVVQACALAILLFRHVELPRFDGWLDRHFLNPGPRESLVAKSPVLDFVRPRPGEAHRVSGVERALFLTYPTYVGLEGVFSIEALQDPAVRAFQEVIFGREAMASNFPIIAAPNTAGLLPALQMFNVRYMVALARTPRLDALPVAGRYDLWAHDVPGYWPRAFATTSFAEVSDAQALWARLNEDSRPFGTRPTDGVAREWADLGAGRHVAATDYVLGESRTAFTLTVPGPCVAVLCEAGNPDSFECLVNGERRPVVKSAFLYKGVVLEAAGTYRIEFRAWPAGLTTGLWLAVGGGLMGLGCWWSGGRLAHVGRPVDDDRVAGSGALPYRRGR